MKKETGRKLIEEKIQDFEKNSAVLKKKGHGETNIRSNYIDVFFEALGWNMKSHYDVVREFSQVDTSGTKRVDYAFKVNGKLKFFVEAKEASIDLVNDKDAIYQAKRYAYSTNGKAPVVILTDFEEFRVFNVLKAPDYNNTDRELMKKFSFEYTGYLENWDILWDTFSKEAVTAGSLETLRGKIDKNTKTMDVDFLEQITGWRETLAKTIALRNKELTVDELNEAVQRILDRLLFIRNLEDREIEPENTLLDKTKKSENIYKSLIPVFNNLDNVYNGLLFKKHFSEELVIDDKTIKDIIKSMCYPVSPFQFDVIEPEILGRIYEKFLGSKIRLTENHQAKIEEKMEVRKAGGVYYTPEYIVNYIVENTVGKKLNPASPPNPPEGGFSTNSQDKGLQPLALSMTPDEIKSIKICDPACGSGSFLLGAYSYLLDYHEKWYAKASADDKKKYKADFYKTKDGEIKVTLEKRGDILRSNIFGVDIDKEATEVAIMSLYLKMLDDGFDKGERDLFFIKGHVLPDMTDNIKCGNSLIGTDYFDGKLEIDIEEMKEIKAFDWEKEFKDIFSRRGAENAEGGGFDCVIGNPPYSSKQSIDTQKMLPFYECVEYKCDPYAFFIEKGYKLLKDEGLLSFIVPVTWMTNYYYMKLRKLLIDNASLNKIILIDGLVFENANVDTSLLFLKKNGIRTDGFEWLKAKPESLKSTSSFRNYESVKNEERYDIVPNADENWIGIKEKMDKQSVQLSSISKISLGMKLRANDEFVVKEKNDKNPHPIIFGKEISRYGILQPENYFNYDTSVIIGGTKKREVHTAKPKIFVQAIRNLSLKRRIVATIDSEGYYFIGTVNGIIFTDNINPFYVLGILNSNLINTYFSKRFTTISLTAAFLGVIPIKIVNDAINSEVKQRENIIILVDQMLQAQKDCRSCKNESDKKLYEQKIGMLDKKIDDLVYKLYGLSDDEIRIVEGA
jgi:type I restriction-modification system DNA methylase subunit